MLVNKVSVISPVYNGASYIDILLESILFQTYKDIELIIVDDGSIDRTKEIIDEYKEKYQEKGYEFVYSYQEHKGQAAAINNGLKLIHGDFVKWIDGDDCLENTTIEKEVDFLINNKEYGMVMCGAKYINFKTKDVVLVKSAVEDKYKNDLFNCYVKGGKALPGSGSILVRKEALLKAVPNLHIYESKEGQNLQLMLPLAYSFKCGYIEEPLFIRTLREDSHGLQKRTYQEEKNRNNNFITLYDETFKIMNITNKEELMKEVNIHFSRNMLNIASRHRQLSDVYKELKYLVNNHAFKYVDLKKSVIYLIKGKKK